jgi:predicted permease
MGRVYEAPLLLTSGAVTDLLSIFVDVLAPVFLVVAIGFLVGRLLDLDPRPLARVAYYVFVPAFVFDVLVTSELAGATVVRVVGVLTLTTIAVALLAWGLGRGMRRTRSVTVAWVLVAVFGNVGNLGIAVNVFEFGEDAADLAGIAFLTVNVLAFFIGVGAIRWGDSHPLRAIGAALATPGVLGAVPAVLLNASDAALPQFLDRMVGILAAGLIPAMLITLGLQLAATRDVRLGLDVAIGSGLRLVAAPLLAAAAVAIVGLEGDAGGVTILMSAMPAAVLTGIISIEYQLEPELVTTTVLVSTVASVATLAVVLALL